MIVFQNWTPGQQVFGLWILSIFYFFIMGWVGISLFTEFAGWGPGVPEQLFSTPHHPFHWFVRWDSGYYLKIAEHGYAANGTERAFYPLYPLLASWLSTFTGLSLSLIGLLISLATFAGAAFTLHAWVRLDHSQPMALMATTLLCFSPVSYYFIAFYPEALFMCLSLLSLYCLRRGWFLVAGFFIAITGATRPTAFLLGVVYLAEVIQQRPHTTRVWVMAVLGALIAPLGMVAYFTYIGYPDGFLAGFAAYSTLLDQEWDTKYDWPWVLIFNAVAAVLFETNIHHDWFSRAYTLHDLGFALIGLGIGLWAMRRLRLSWSIFLFASLLYVFILHGPGGYAFDSAPRRLLVIAPLYPACALWLERLSPRLRWAVLGVMVLWLGVLTAWFTSGRWVS